MSVGSAARLEWTAYGSGQGMSETGDDAEVQQNLKGKKRLHLRAVRGEQPLETVGAELRAARLKKGEEVDVIADKLKIRRDILQALEDSDYGKHPPKVYAIGFVRAYATYLGLDATVMVKRYKGEIAGRPLDRAPSLNFPVAPSDGGVPGVALLLAAAVIGGLAYGGWSLTQTAKQDSVSQVVSEVEAQRLADEAAAAAPGPLGVPADSVLLAQQMAEPATPAPKVYGDIEGAVRITLRATDDCYVRIRDLWSDPNPKVIFEQILTKGETYRVPNRGGLWLRAGNAGALMIEVDGKDLGALGKPGDTADRISLLPAKLISRNETGGEESAPASDTSAASAPAGPAPVSASPAADVSPNTNPTSTPAPNVPAPPSGN